MEVLVNPTQTSQSQPCSHYLDQMKKQLCHSHLRKTTGLFLYFIYSDENDPSSQVIVFKNVYNARMGKRNIGHTKNKPVAATV